MRLDKYNEFSDGQAVTASAASTNVVDLAVARDLGLADRMWLIVQVDTAATAAGAATVTFDLQTDDNEGFSSATTLHTSGAIGKATLVAGYQVLRIRVPSTTEQYIRMYYTVATGPLTAGAFSAFLTTEPQAWEAKDDGIA